jgi:hypothetical protein
MKRIIATLFLAIIAACTTAPKTPAQTVFLIESDYAAALTIAVQYKALPDCAIAQSVICSKLDVVAKIQKADDVAYPLLQAAQKVVRVEGAGANAQTAVMAAQQAVAALTSITQTLQVK